MSFSMFVTWVLLGVLAGLVANREGDGLKTDIILGLVGSIGLSWIFRAAGLFPNAGIIAMAFVAFIGAAIAIAAQRKLRPTDQSGETAGATGTIWRWALRATERNPIKLEDMRTEPTLRFATYGSDRLDPGQEAVSIGRQ
jgi:uncharacterized membrane protein YeaQ/YmgE (transglycosylase-associated protein family)